MVFNVWERNQAKKNSGNTLFYLPAMKYVAEELLLVDKVNTCLGRLHL